MTAHGPVAASRKELRSFGLIVGGAFALIGLWPLLVHHLPVRTWALVLAALLGGAALLAPAALRVPRRGWMAVGRALGFVNTRIILFVFFYLILTPAGLVLRWLGKDPMRRSFEPRIETYRIPREARDGSHMRHQF